MNTIELPTLNQAALKSPPHLAQAHSEELWEATYRLLEQSISPNQVAAWIQPLHFQKAEKVGTSLKVSLTVPNDFSGQWVRDQFKGAIEAALAQVSGTECELLLVVREATADTVGAIGYEVEAPSENAALPETTVPTQAKSVSISSDNRVDSRYTFDNYVVGASNQFAHASAVAVAEHPAKQYNPLFLYSPSGLGKTHLLHAIGNHVMAKNPKARVAYLSAEKFVNELIESLQHRKMSQFRAKYRDSYEMIMIDDIQFIAGKNTSEEEFFHTFNALHGSKRQIIVTSDRAPKEIEGFDARIRSRFEWGLVADITPPEIETRIAILKSKAEREDIYLPDDVATFLASCVKSNVRELEGILIRLQAQASLSGAEISLEMAKQELRSLLPEDGSQFTVESIQGAVARHFRIKISDLRSTSRVRTVALPRQIAMYLIRKYTGIGFKEIGHYFGGKDHTTVMHAVSRIEDGIEKEAPIREAVESVQNQL